MRAVLQRVTQRRRSRSTARWSGPIDRPGLLALVGVTHDDGPDQVRALARKIAELRILRDERVGARRGRARPRRQPVHALRRHPQGAATVVERGRTGPGRRAARRRPSSTALRARGVEVATGRFGAMMQVSLVNDGPVTLVVDV